MKRLTFLSALLIFFSYSNYSQLSIRQIKPSDTDPLITTFNTDSNYVYYNNSVSAQNILVVHLPGSFGEPKRATLFGSLAANLGFHSIGLMYPNAPTVGSFCSNSTNASCFEDVRREIIEGVDYSTDVSISVNESILSRTKKLLMYLQANFPSENWGQYLDINGNIIYNKVIFSGHSQGGGHAAVIAKYYPIKRALCFSSPKDWRNIPDAPPLWLSSGNWQTSSSNIYAFNHILDEHTNHQLQIWDSLGLNIYGAPINVDSFASPYNNTRQLTTSYNVPLGDDHACTIQDNKTPKTANVPVFTPVWTYMLKHNLDVGINETKETVSKALLIKPNPIEDTAVIDLPENGYILELFDISGKKIQELETESKTLRIDLSELNKGVYFIKATSTQSVLNAKIVKL